MADSLGDVVEELESKDDPRLDTEFWTALPAGEHLEHPVVLVGTVHDHPASCSRVRSIVREFDPEILGLELPTLAIPYYQRLARRRSESDTTSCEMSSAIGTSPETTVVGIDTFGAGFFRKFVQTARERSVSPRTVGRVLKDVGHITRHAIACRVTVFDAQFQEPRVDHDSRHSDTPAQQADDERKQVARSRSLLGAIEQPQADLLLDETREKNMAGEIQSLSREAPVLAVLGLGHIEDIVAQLQVTPLS